MCKSLNMAWDVIKCLPMLLILINHSHGTADSSCQTDWTYYSGRCYTLVTTAVSHHSAQAGCRGKEATLATIGNDGEHDFLNTIDKSLEVWIGLTRAEHNCGKNDETCQRSNWMWADETPYRYPEFHKWGYTDPQSNELCARIHPRLGGRWYGKPCDSSHAYICEKGISTTTSTTTTSLPTTTTKTTSKTVTPTSTTSTTTVTSTSTTSKTTETPTSTASTTTAIPTSRTTLDPARTTDDSATTASSDAVVTITLNSLMTLSSDEHQTASSSKISTEQSSLQSKYETVKLVVIVVYSVLGVLLLTIAVEVFILYRHHKLPWQGDDVTKDDVSSSNTE